MFWSRATGEVIAPEWLTLHYPLYRHYSILQALLILSRWGPLLDLRLDQVLDIIEKKHLPDGCWQVEGLCWRPPGKAGSNVEVVNLGRKGANVMITLNAHRVSKAAGR